MTDLGVDAAEALARRLHERGGAVADSVGHVAQTRHQQLAARDDRRADALWDVAGTAARLATPRLELLRLVTITTDSAGSFAAWVRSLRTTLDEVGWRAGRGPTIEVLRVANDSDPSIDAEHRQVSAEGITIRVVNTDPARRPLPLAEARPLAFVHLRELGWVPSVRAPVWSLDEDFRFDTLGPSPSRMYARRSGAPLLHRLDALVARLAAEGVDILVGGNSGAAPVPSLALMRAQLEDLTSRPVSGAADGTPLELLARLEDGYYDLAEEPNDTLRVPLARAWWREDGRIEPSEIIRRLQAGLPVTRPALATPLRHPPSAWAAREHTGAAGGNSMLLSARALDARFAHVRHGSLVSRRADTTWVIDARARGARVVRAALPFFHDRQRRPQVPADAARDALADALGVGLYRSTVAGDTSEATVLARANARLAALRVSLTAAEAAAWRVRIGGRDLAALAGWIAEARESLAAAGTSVKAVEGAVC